MVTPRCFYMTNYAALMGGGGHGTLENSQKTVFFPISFHDDLRWVRGWSADVWEADVKETGVGTGTYVFDQICKNSSACYTVWLRAVMVTFPFPLFLHLLCPPVLGAGQSSPKGAGRRWSPPSWFCPRVSLTSIKRSGKAGLVMCVSPKEPAPWSYGKGGTCLWSPGMGGNSDVQVQTMTRKLLRGSARDSQGEDLNLSSAVLGPWLRSNSPQKNGSYSISASQRVIISNTEVLH